MRLGSRYWRLRLISFYSSMRCRLKPSTFSASAASIFRYAGVFKRVFMPVPAMRSGETFFTSCRDGFGVVRFVHRDVAAHDNHIKRETETGALFNHPRFNAVSVGKFDGFVSRPLNCHDNVAPMIALLLRFRGPSAIVRAVRTIVVAPVYGVLGGGLWPHIQQKVFEPTRVWFSPSFTNPNSAHAVVGVAGSGRSMATVDHGSVRAIQRMASVVLHKATIAPVGGSVNAKVASWSMC